MEEIKRLFDAYVNSKEYTPYTEEAASLHERIFDMLSEMLPKKEYGEIETDLNTYSNMIEEAAFITGFKVAVRMITGSIQK